MQRLGFPAWGKLNRPGRNDSISAPFLAKFTLSMNPEARSYKPGQPATELEFTEAANLIYELRSTLKLENKEGMMQYTAVLEEEMATFIFSSNANERAGLDHEETRRICRRVFAGENIVAADVDTRSPTYEGNLKYLKKTNEIRNPGLEHVIRARREIIQHAQALQYIIDAALNRDQPLTEEVIKETHRILCEGISLGREFGNDAREKGSYAGVYRTVDVFAGSTSFTQPHDVPKEMQIFINDFHDDVYAREDSGKLDPFYLAADACQDFVMIHPFLDGNGRMCRLLLNAYLIRYAGVVMNIGEHDAERSEYMAIVKEAGDEDEEVARGKLGRMVLERGTMTLRKLVARVKK